MQLFRKYLLVVSLLFSFHSSFAQQETENLVQILQTASFNSLLPFWDNQVEINFLEQDQQKMFSANEANQQLKNFYNKYNIIGFEKTAERKLGNTIYITGKLSADQRKFSLTIMLQSTKKGLIIVSARIS